MKHLWAPWRMEFILGKKKPKGCIFCTFPKEKKDKQNLIVFRGKHTFVILNRYPYNNGHLMVIPYRHTANLADLERDELSELMSMTTEVVNILKKTHGPQGFNLGMNLGAAAGAGIKEHLHMHIVPRWVGDTNFMTVLGEVRSIPNHLTESFIELSTAFKKANLKENL